MEKDEMEVQLKILELDLQSKNDEIKKLKTELDKKTEELQIKEKESRLNSWRQALSLLRIPLVVESLQLQLVQSPFDILTIHRKWEEMVIWRNTILDRVMEDNSQESSRIPSSEFLTLNDETTTVTSMDLIADQFQSIDSLGNDLGNTLWKNICNYGSPSLVDDPVPTTCLKDCLSIIADTDKDPTTDRERVLRSAMIQIHFAGDDGLIQYERMRDRCLDELEKAVVLQCIAAVSYLTKKPTQLRRRDSTDSTDDDSASSQLLKSLYIVNDAVVASFPEEYFDVKNAFHHRIVSVLQNTINDLTLQAPVLGVNVALPVVNWLDLCQRDASVLGWEEILPNLVTADAAFSAEYIDFIQRQVQETKDSKKGSTVKSLPSGILVSGWVEELVTYVETQVTFLASHLSGRRFREAAQLLCTGTFQARQQFQHDELISINNSNFDELPEAYFKHVCAVVNDNERIESSIESVYAASLKGISDEASTSERVLLRRVFNEISNGFESVVHEALRALVVFMFRDVGEILRTSLFTDEWLLHSTEPLLVALNTIDDFLQDVKKYVSNPNHVNQVGQVSLDRLIRNYIEVLVGSPDIYFQPDEMSKVACRILNDAEAITEYGNEHFDKKESDAKKLSLENVPSVQESVLVLEIVSQFFSASEPGYLFSDLARVFGKVCGPVFRQMITLRSDCEASVKTELTAEALEWQTWAEHNCPKTSRFNIENSTSWEAGEDSVVDGESSKKPRKAIRKATALLGKGLRATAEKGMKATTNLKKPKIKRLSWKSLKAMRQRKTEEKSEEKEDSSS